MTLVTRLRQSTQLLANDVTVTADYAATSVDLMILCNGTLTITLPFVTTDGSDRLYHINKPGKIYHIINSGSGLVTVVGRASQTISSQSSIELIESNALSIFTDGSNWLIF